MLQLKAEFKKSPHVHVTVIMAGDLGIRL